MGCDPIHKEVLKGQARWWRDLVPEVQYTDQSRGCSRAFLVVRSLWD
jgi:hypothetical protein